MYITIYLFNDNLAMASIAQRSTEEIQRRSTSKDELRTATCSPTCHEKYFKF